MDRTLPTHEKTWLGRNKNLLLIAVIVAVVFYWFELRPVLAKQGCYTQAKEQAIEKGKDELPDGKYRKDDYDTYYKWCLQSKGL